MPNSDPAVRRVQTREAQAKRREQFRRRTAALGRIAATSTDPEARRVAADALADPTAPHSIATPSQPVA